jgi:hypothetical protein
MRDAYFMYLILWFDHYNEWSRVQILEVLHCEIFSTFCHSSSLLGPNILLIILNLFVPSRREVSVYTMLVEISK